MPIISIRDQRSAGGDAMRTLCYKTFFTILEQTKKVQNFYNYCKYPAAIIFTRGKNKTD